MDIVDTLKSRLSHTHSGPQSGAGKNTMNADAGTSSYQSSDDQHITATPDNLGLPAWPEPDWSAPITRDLVLEMEHRANIAGARVEELQPRIEQLQRRRDLLQAEADRLLARMDTLSDPLLEEAIARQEVVKDDADQRTKAAGERLMRVSRRNTGNQRWLYTMSGNKARREEDEARADFYRLSAHSSMLRKEGQALQDKQSALLQGSDRLMQESERLEAQIRQYSREVAQLLSLSSRADATYTHWMEHAQRAREILDWWD